MVFYGCWFSERVYEWGFSSWLSRDKRESGSCGWGVGMRMDVRISEGDDVGSGMVTFGLIVWGAEIGG